jgi:hypothetical protein
MRASFKTLTRNSFPARRHPRDPDPVRPEPSRDRRGVDDAVRIAQSPLRDRPAKARIPVDAALHERGEGWLGVRI